MNICNILLIFFTYCALHNKYKPKIIPGSFYDIFGTHLRDVVHFRDVHSAYVYVEELLYNNQFTNLFSRRFF